MLWILIRNSSEDIRIALENFKHEHKKHCGSRTDIKWSLTSCWCKKQCWILRHGFENCGISVNWMKSGTDADINYEYTTRRKRNVFNSLGIHNLREKFHWLFPPKNCCFVEQAHEIFPHYNNIKLMIKHYIFALSS